MALISPFWPWARTQQSVKVPGAACPGAVQRTATHQGAGGMRYFARAAEAFSQASVEGRLHGSKRWAPMQTPGLRLCSGVIPTEKASPGRDRPRVVPANGLGLTGGSGSMLPPRRLASVTWWFVCEARIIPRVLERKSLLSAYSPQQTRLSCKDAQQVQAQEPCRCPPSTRTLQTKKI